MEGFFFFEIWYLDVSLKFDEKLFSFTYKSGTLHEDLHVYKNA